MKNWISIVGIMLLIGGMIVLAIASYYNFGTCPPLPKGESCDNAVGIITTTVSIMMFLLGIGLSIITIRKRKFQLKSNS